LRIPGHKTHIPQKLLSSDLEGNKNALNNKVGLKHIVWYGTWKAAGARFFILESEETIRTAIPGK